MGYRIRAINREDQEVIITFEGANNPDEALAMLEDEERQFAELFCIDGIKPVSILSRIKKILSVRRIHDS
jgi:hypothetical protein